MGSIASIPTSEGDIPPDKKFLEKLDDLLFEFFGGQGMGGKVMPYFYEVKVDKDGTAYINLEIYKVQYFKNSETNDYETKTLS